MKFELKIQGMTCTHCSGRVQSALESISGVSANVSHKKGKAIVEMDSQVDKQDLVNAVQEAGYKVIEVKEI